MPNCSVIGCGSSDKRQKGISFHKLPKDPVQRAVWIKAINRPNWVPNTHATICSRHFPEGDMDRTSLSCIRLREGVVPSLFDGSISKVNANKSELLEKKTLKTFKKVLEKISFEELIRKRGKFKKELNEVTDELIKTRKEMKRLCQIKRRTHKKINTIRETLSLKNSSEIKQPKEELERELEDAHIRLKATKEEIVMLNASKDSISARKTDLECKLKCFPVPLKLKLDNILPSQDVDPLETAGSSKSALDNLDDGEKNQKGRPKKKRKIIENEECKEGDGPEDYLQDPLGMMDIEEPRIKQEIFETEEFSEEYQDPLQETPSSFNANNTNAVEPEFTQMEIKVEPLAEEEEEENDEDVIEPKSDIHPLSWRCPLVSCSEKFSAELEMYQHLNINHAGKGLVESSKSKKISEPRSESVTSISTFKQLPITPPQISPSTSASTDFVFITAASSPSVSPMILVSSPVPTSQSVPFSSSGPITVTTTISYSSLTTLSAPHVTTLSSVANASVISPVASSVAVMSTFECSPISPPTSCLPALSSVETLTTSDRSPPLSVDAKTICCVNSFVPLPNPLSVTSSQRHKNITGTTMSSEGSDLILPEEQQKPETKSSKAQPLHIFHPTGSKIEYLPQSATDESEMFSISLSGFPKSKRGPIKRKLIEVVDCISQNNISPNELLIAYYVNSSDSRTM